MRVQRRDRADGPADEHHLDQLVAEDLVAGVAVGEPLLIVSEIFVANFVRAEILVDLLLGDEPLGQLANPVDELLDRDGRGRIDGSLHRVRLLTNHQNYSPCRRFEQFPSRHASLRAP